MRYAGREHAAVRHPVSGTGDCFFLPEEFSAFGSVDCANFPSASVAMFPSGFRKH